MVQHDVLTHAERDDGMSAMKISLDAAMRARDVSPDWRDDARLDPLDSTARAGDHGAPSVPVEPLRSDTPPTTSPADTAQAEHSGDQRRRTASARRRRRSRLRHGRPT